MDRPFRTPWYSPLGGPLRDAATQRFPPWVRRQIVALRWLGRSGTGPALLRIWALCVAVMPLSVRETNHLLHVAGFLE